MNHAVIVTDRSRERQAGFAGRCEFAKRLAAVMLFPMHLPRLLFAAVALALAGCSTFEKRAAQKSAVFNALDAPTQAKLKEGVVEIGYTPDVVYIALGSPDRRTEEVTAKGRKETWIYNSYYSEYRGTEHVGYRRMVEFDPITKKYFVYYEPMRVDVYRDRIDERIRITFVEGKVSVIEQAKDN
ncbi:MAG: hypothetical protein RIS54_87 [Verrucomicrobiota bacterium]|jgi:hypothetical protein